MLKDVHAGNILNTLDIDGMSCHGLSTAPDRIRALFKLGDHFIRDCRIDQFELHHSVVDGVFGFHGLGLLWRNFYTRWIPEESESVNFYQLIIPKISKSGHEFLLVEGNLPSKWSMFCLSIIIN